MKYNLPKNVQGSKNKLNQLEFLVNFLLRKQKEDSVGEGGQGGESLPSGGNNDILFHNGEEYVSVTPIVDIQTGITGTTVTLPSTPITSIENFLDVTVGIPRIQGEDNDYTISGDVITFQFTLQASDIIRTKYIVA